MESNNLERSRKTGLWSEPGVPHKGWMLTGDYDNGELGPICQMCCVQPIRYVFTVTHPDYPEELHVGCVCCENLTDDLVTPKLREKKMKADTRRKEKAVLKAKADEVELAYLRTILDAGAQRARK